MHFAIVRVDWLGSVSSSSRTYCMCAVWHGGGHFGNTDKRECADEMGRNGMEGTETVIDQQQMTEQGKGQGILCVCVCAVCAHHERNASSILPPRRNQYEDILLSVRPFDAKCNKYVKFEEEKARSELERNLEYER